MHDLDLANIQEHSHKLQGHLPSTLHDLDLANICEHSHKLQGEVPSTVHDLDLANMMSYLANIHEHKNYRDKHPALCMT